VPVDRETRSRGRADVRAPNDRVRAQSEPISSIWNHLGLTHNGDNPFVDQATMGGGGGAVTVTHAGAVTTHGDGAIGILAQSVGGGGILGGDLAASNGTVIAHFETRRLRGRWLYERPSRQRVP
jgi:hypothetical protein